MFIRLSFVTLIFALGGLGTPLIKRDGTDVLQYLRKLDEQTNMLYENLNKLPTMGSSAVKDIETNVANMDADLKAATDDTSNSKDFTADQTNDILVFVEKQLELDVEKTLINLVSKKDTMNTLGVVPLAKFSLQTLQADTVDFANAFVPKVPETQQSRCEEAFDKIEKKLSDALHEYST